MFIADTKQTGCATSGWFNRSTKILIRVKRLDSLEANSATQVSISTDNKPLHIPELKLVVNGMSKLSIKSLLTVEELQLSLNGMSQYDGIINPAIKYIVLTYLIGALENPAQMRKSA